MGWCSFLVPVMVLAATVGALAQAPVYNLGRTPTPEEIRAWDISIPPTGKGLPPGKGTAKEGTAIYARKCAACHGAEGQGGPANRLVAVKANPNSKEARRGARTMGSFWPFATLVWDYINRAMPFRQGGSLTADEVYALTAFLLYKNDIIQEGDVLDAQSLPKVQMPNRKAFTAPPLADWKVGGPRPFKVIP